MKQPAMVVAAALLVAGLGGCPHGKDPPALTALITIPGGSFSLGSAALACGDPKDKNELRRCDLGQQSSPMSWLDQLSWVPRARARLASFAIEQHEVTNVQYSWCVEAGKCTAPASTAIDGTEYYEEAKYDNYPVVHVTREQAAAYCAFIGRKLPSEAQWEVAARLDDSWQLRALPYAGAADPSCTSGAATHLIHHGCGEPKLPLPVNYSSADVSGLKVRNMASNVAEWVLDDWNRFAYCEDKKDGLGPACQQQGINCERCQPPNDKVKCAASCDPSRLVICKPGEYKLQQGPQGSERVVRGGSYLLDSCALRLFVRRKAPASPGPDIGFRCVQTGGTAVPDGGSMDAKLSPDQGPAPDAAVDAGADAALEGGGADG